MALVRVGEQRVTPLPGRAPRLTLEQAISLAPAPKQRLTLEQAIGLARPAAVTSLQTAPPQPTDSWGELGTKLIQNAPTMFKQAGGGLAQAIGEQPFSPGGTAGVMGGFEPEEAIQRERAAAQGGPTEWGRRIYGEATADLQANAPNVDPMSLKGLSYDIAQATIQMVPMIATSLATRSPGAGLSVMSGQVYGPRYAESRAKGRSPEQSTADAVFYTAAEVIPETIPLGILMRPGQRFLPRVFKAAGAESIQEVFTEALQAGYEAGVLDEKTPWAEVPGRLARAGIIGAGAGAAIAAGTHPFVREERQPAQPGAEAGLEPGRPGPQPSPEAMAEGGQRPPRDFTAEFEEALGEPIGREETPLTVPSVEEMERRERKLPAVVRPEPEIIPPERPVEPRARPAAGVRITLDQAKALTAPAPTAALPPPPSQLPPPSAAAAPGRARPVPGGTIPSGPTIALPGPAEAVPGAMPPAPAEQRPAAGAPEQRIVPVAPGSKIIHVSTGMRLKSKSGRELSPIPKVSGHTAQQAKMTIRRLDAWLIDEARKEAQASGDRFYIEAIIARDPNRMSVADRELANDIIFGRTGGPTEADLVPPAPPQRTEATKPAGGQRKEGEGQFKAVRESQSTGPKVRNVRFNVTTPDGGSIFTVVSFPKNEQPGQGEIKRRAIANAREIWERRTATRVPSAPVEAPSKTPQALSSRPASLFEFIAKTGGISDPGGELKAMDLHRRFLKPFGKLVRSKGRSPDYVREAATEARYLPEGATIGDLFEAMRREEAGEKIYAEGEQQEMDARVAERAAKASEARARDDIRSYAEEIGEQFTDIEVHEIALQMVRDDLDAEAAVSNFAERKAIQAAEQIAKDTGDESYADIPFEAAPARPAEDDLLAGPRNQGQADQAADQDKGAAGEAVAGEDREVGAIRLHGVATDRPGLLDERDFIKATELRAAERASYFDAEGNKIASSRENPAREIIIPDGAWVIDDDFKGIYGRDIEQYRLLNPNDLIESEDSRGRETDVERYAEWLKQGKRPPPIDVIETIDGKLKVSNGHRRWRAAKAVGVKVPAMVSPITPIDKLDAQGKPILVGLTYELAQKRDQAPRPTTETTPEGEQHVIPGAEQISQREAIERKMQGRDVRKGQKGLEGAPLFDEGARAEQEDLFSKRKYTSFDEAFLGIPIRKIWDLYLDPFFSWALDPLSGLPHGRAYKAMRYRAQGRADISDRITREIHDKIRALDPQTKEKLYEYLTTPGANSRMVPTAARDLAENTKQLINLLGRQLVVEGILEPEQEAKYRDAYLPRMYLKHVFAEDIPVGLAGNRPRVPNEMMGRIKRRKDIPRWERDILLGEIKDPAFLTAKAIGTAAHSIAVLKMLKQIAANPEWVYPNSTLEWRGRRVSVHWLMSEADRLRRMAHLYPKKFQAEVRLTADQMQRAAESVQRDPQPTEGYEQIPNTKRYGYLRGMWVRKAIYDDLVNSVTPEWRDTQLRHLHRIYRSGVGIWKGFKTAWSVSGQVRNFVSGFMQADMFGDVPIWRLPDQMMKTMRDIAHKGPRWKFATQHGVRSTSFAQSELLRIHQDFKLKASLKEYNRNPLRLLKEFGVRINDKVGDAYSFNEQFWKTLVMGYHMDQGMAPDEAAILAHEAIFDYSNVPNWLRAFRENALIGNWFVTFAAKSLPKTLEVALTKPWKFLPYVGIIYGSWAWLTYAQDLDDEEKEGLKALLPEWQQHGLVAWLPSKDEHDRWQPIDVSYYLPWGGWWKVAVGASHGDISEVARELGIAGNPAVGTVLAIRTNRDGLGREIYREGAPPAEQIRDFSAYMLDQMLPPWAGPHGQVGKLIEAIEGSVDRHGNPQLSVRQALLRFLGTNIWPVDRDQALAIGMYIRQRAIEDARAQMRRIATDRSLSPQNRQEEMRRQQAWLQEMQKAAQKWMATASRAPK